MVLNWARDLDLLLDSISGRLAGLNGMRSFVGRQTGGRVNKSTNVTVFERCRGKSFSLHVVDVRELCKEGKFKQALDILDRMDVGDIANRVDAYGILLQGCINRKILVEGKRIHAHIIRSEFQPNIVLWNMLVNMYSKCGSIDDAREVFDKMTKRNVVTWNSMIEGYARHAHGEKALELFSQLQQDCLKPSKVTFLGVLKACTHLTALEKGKQIHACIIKSGLELDIFVGSALIGMYTKCGCIERADQVFNKMPERDVVSWNSMIAGYIQNGHGDKALSLFQQMRCKCVKPSKVTFIIVLKACTCLAALEEGKQIHADIIKSGLESDVFVRTALVDMYAKSGNIEHACQVFDKMPERDVASWNAMITGFAQNGHGEESLKLFCQMQQGYMKPNHVTFVSILKACASLTALEQGKQVHAFVIKNGLELDVFVGNALLDMYVKCGSMDHARQMFDKMSKQNVASWTIMIAGYAQHRHGHDALKLFQQMQDNCVEPSNLTFISALKACGSLESLEQGKQIHAQIIASGHESDAFVRNALVDMYVKCGSEIDARQVFDNTSNRDVVSWTAMIAGYAQHGQCEEVLKLFWQMQCESIKPDDVIFIILLKACANSASLEQGKQIHLCLIESGLKLDVYVGSTLVDMYAKCWSIVDARQVFDKMPERDVVTWNVMIAGYSLHSLCEEGLKLFWQMQLENVEPDNITFISVLKACASLTALEQGKQIHACIIESGLKSDMFVGNALIDMHAKCGNIEQARKVFADMPERDIVSWNAMITGYAQHGHGEEALQLFEEMIEEGMKVDQITFVGVLSACSHAGLVDEGHCYFDFMSHDHGITPGEEHYTCMVDLLARSGCMEEAEDFMKTMPIRPTAMVWIALLGACRVHGKVELAKHVAEFILELEPQNDAAFVLLSNIHAAASRWDDKAKVRKIMEARGVRKKLGHSCIEVNNQVHMFVVEDASHPQTKEIYAELNRLSLRMADAGYVPDTRFVLHDVDNEQKEFSICHHSEKLAIAFALISTPDGLPICIINNLRVCGDCHTATKFISVICNREIVIRDANRFHHFKDGVCSCSDYW